MLSRGQRAAGSGQRIVGSGAASRRRGVALHSRNFSRTHNVHYSEKLLVSELLSCILCRMILKLANQLERERELYDVSFREQ